MKKLLTISLVLLLVLGMMPGVAMAADTLKISNAEEFRYPTDTSVKTAFTIENTNKYDVDVTIEVFDQTSRSTIRSMTYTILQGDAPLQVPAEIFHYMEKNGDFRLYRYKITTTGGFSRFVYIVQKLTITKDANGAMYYYYDQYRNGYFYNNTVSSFGPHFRDVTPELTKLWYMFTPIDLSIQGRQTFVLVASNMYEIGEAYVDVNGDSVLVSYHMYHDNKNYYNTEKISEFLTFYNSYADVSIVEPEDMKQPSRFAFNQPISILNHLGGDTNVLMFIRNRITYFAYPTPNSEYIRFWENKPEYKDRRENMLRFMDPIMVVENNK